MSRFGLIVASLVVLLVSSSPALAQTAGPDQYDGGVNAAAVGEGVRDATDTAAQGTEAVNEALSGTAPAVSSASTVPAEVAGLTELPETGGPSLLLPGVGILLVASGLMVRRVSG